MLTTLYLLLRLVGNGRQLNLPHANFNNCKWPPWAVWKWKTSYNSGKESFLAKSTTWKPSEFSEDHADKFNLSHARHTLALQTHTDGQTDRQTDYNNPRAHARRALKMVMGSYDLTAYMHAWAIWYLTRRCRFAIALLQSVKLGQYEASVVPVVRWVVLWVCHISSPLPLRNEIRIERWKEYIHTVYASVWTRFSRSCGYVVGVICCPSYNHLDSPSYILGCSPRVMYLSPFPPSPSSSQQSDAKYMPTLEETLGINFKCSTCLKTCTCTILTCSV